MKTLFRRLLSAYVAGKFESAYPSRGISTTRKSWIGRTSVTSWRGAWSPSRERAIWSMDLTVRSYGRSTFGIRIARHGVMSAMVGRGSRTDRSASTRHPLVDDATIRDANGYAPYVSKRMW